MNTIIFQNREFKIREVYVPKYGNVLISINTLNNLLINETGGYVSDEAIIVDENIFYFIEDSEMELSDEEMVNLIISEDK